MTNGPRYVVVNKHQIVPLDGVEVMEIDKGRMGLSIPAEASDSLGLPPLMCVDRTTGSDTLNQNDAEGLPDGKVLREFHETGNPDPLYVDDDPFAIPERCGGDEETGMLQVVIARMRKEVGGPQWEGRPMFPIRRLCKSLLRL